MARLWDTPAYTVRGTTITPDHETGIGAWSDAEIRRALTHGVSRDGRAFKPPMARQDYFSKHDRRRPRRARRMDTHHPADRMKHRPHPPGARG